MGTSGSGVEVVAELPPELTAIVKQEGVSAETSGVLIETYRPMHGAIVRALGQSAGVRDGTDPLQRKLARECRLALRSARCEVETKRKALKVDAVRYGRAVDGMANVLKYLAEPEEARLEQIERHEEVERAKRIEALTAERTATLVAVGVDPTVYNLGLMDEATWAAVLAGAEQAKAAREEAARRAEADRIAQEQADRMAREEAERDAAEAREEAARQRVAREAAEAKGRAERLEADRKLVAERAARVEAERKAAEARAREQARVEAERKAAAAKAQAEHDAREQAAAAPDKDRLMGYAKAIAALAVPTCSTEAGRACAVLVTEAKGRFVRWIADRVGRMGQ